MEFTKIFIPAHVKFNFLSDNKELILQKQWTECRISLKPSPNSNRHIQINCVPNSNDESTPYFVQDIDYTRISSRKIDARSKSNAFGIFWSIGEKTCRIFISTEDEVTHRKFSKYLKKLLKFFELYNSFENDKNVSFVNVLPVDHDDKITKAEENQSNENTPIEVMQIVDASGAHEDVILRPKNKTRHRFVRPLAVLSDLFKFNRDSDLKTKTGTEAHGTHESNYEKKKNSKTFKSKVKNRSESSTFLHFQEPLDMETIPDIHCHNDDLQWYDLNIEQMNIVENRNSMILDKLYNNNEMNTNFEAESAFDRNSTTKHMNISSNILWSHNLSLSCQSIANVSNINLLGANTNKEQMYSEVYIEDNNMDEEGKDAKLNISIKSQSNAYRFMKPIDENCVQQSHLLVERIAEKIEEFNRLASIEASHGLESLKFGKETDGLISKYRDTFSSSLNSVSTSTSDSTDELITDTSSKTLRPTILAKCFVKHIEEDIKEFDNSASLGASLDSGSSGIGSESDDLTSQSRKACSKSSTLTSDLSEEIIAEASTEMQRPSKHSTHRKFCIKPKKLLKMLSTHQTSTKTATIEITNESCAADSNLEQQSNQQLADSQLKLDLHKSCEQNQCYSSEQTINARKRSSIFGYLKNKFVFVSRASIYIL